MASTWDGGPLPTCQETRPGEGWDHGKCPSHGPSAATLYGEVEGGPGLAGLLLGGQTP